MPVNLVDSVGLVASGLVDFAGLNDLADRVDLVDLVDLVGLVYFADLFNLAYIVNYIDLADFADPGVPTGLIELVAEARKRVARRCSMQAVDAPVFLQKLWVILDDESNR